MPILPSNAIQRVDFKNGPALKLTIPPIARTPLGLRDYDDENDFDFMSKYDLERKSDDATTLVAVVNVN